MALLLLLFWRLPVASRQWAGALEAADPDASAVVILECDGIGCLLEILRDQFFRGQIRQQASNLIDEPILYARVWHEKCLALQREFLATLDKVAHLVLILSKSRVIVTV